MADWCYTWEVSCKADDSEVVFNLIHNTVREFKLYETFENVPLDDVIYGADFDSSDDIDMENGTAFFEEMPGDPWYRLVDVLNRFGQQLPVFSISYIIESDDPGCWRLYHVGNGQMITRAVSSVGELFIHMGKDGCPDYDSWFGVMLARELDLEITG